MQVEPAYESIFTRWWTALLWSGLRRCGQVELFRELALLNTSFCGDASTDGCRQSLPAWHVRFRFSGGLRAAHCVLLPFARDSLGTTPQEVPDACTKNTSPSIQFIFRACAVDGRTSCGRMRRRKPRGSGHHDRRSKLTSR